MNPCPRLQGNDNYIAMDNREKILVVEDDTSQRETLLDVLSTTCPTAGAENGDEAVALAQKINPAVVVSDLVLPGKTDGIALLHWFNSNMPDVPVILVTGHATVETALDAMKSGAYDYIVKPVDIRRLRAVVQKALERYRLASEHRELLQAMRTDAGLCDIIGASEPMREVFRKILAVSEMDTTVLVVGESGAGKELVAEAIHRLSHRKGELVKVNCTAIPEHLMESELFGYRKGAFTGAHADKPGKFDTADGGTLFLDEIGEMHIPLQAKLLRTIESGEVEPLGATKAHSVNVRIVAATNTNLAEQMKRGRFREDLYYRIGVFAIELPPLRDRREDIPLLISHFLKILSTKLGKRITGISKPVMNALMEYPWRGNVRQLRNTLEEMAILCTGATLDCLPDSLNMTVITPLAARGVRPMRHLEKEAIEAALVETRGNKTAAARLLGIGVRTLFRKIKEYGILVQS